MSTPLMRAMVRQTTSRAMCVAWSNRLDSGWMVGASPARRYLVAAGMTSRPAATAPSGEPGSVVTAHRVAPSAVACSATRTVPPVVPDPETATTVSLPLIAGVVVSPMTNTPMPRCINRIAKALAMNPERPSPVTKTRSAASSDVARPFTSVRSIAAATLVISASTVLS